MISMLSKKALVSFLMIAATVASVKTVHAQKPTVEKVGKHSYRLAHGQICVPIEGFSWRIVSEEPPVYRFENETKDLWLQLTVGPKDQVDLRKENERIYKQAITDLKSEGVLRVRHTSVVNLNSPPNSIGYEITGKIEGKPRSFQGLNVFYPNESFLFLACCGHRDSDITHLVDDPAQKAIDMVLSRAGYFFQPNDDLERLKKQSIPDTAKSKINKEIQRLKKLCACETDAEVDKLLQALMPPQQFKAMKSAGRLPGIRINALEKIVPDLYLTFESINWIHAEKNGNQISFQVPPRGAQFVKVKKDWRFVFR